ncbi:heat shock protein 90-5, chloroplastic [Tanacetum coccineum]
MSTLKRKGGDDTPDIYLHEVDICLKDTIKENPDDVDLKVLVKLRNEMCDELESNECTTPKDNMDGTKEAVNANGNPEGDMLSFTQMYGTPIELIELSDQIDEVHKIVNDHQNYDSQPTATSESSKFKTPVSNLASVSGTNSNSSSILGVKKLEPKPLNVIIPNIVGAIGKRQTIPPEVLESPYIRKECSVDNDITYSEKWVADCTFTRRFTPTDNNLIGKFGVGFYSAFLVADKVSVSTYSPISDKQYVWDAAADSSSYVIREETDPAKQVSNGTEITLYLRDDDKYEFTEPSRTDVGGAHTLRNMYEGVLTCRWSSKELFGCAFKPNITIISFESLGSGYNYGETCLYNIGSARKHGDYTNMNANLGVLYPSDREKMKCQMDYMESIKKLEEKWMSNQPRDGNNGYSNGNHGGKVLQPNTKRGSSDDKSTDVGSGFQSKRRVVLKEVTNMPFNDLNGGLSSGYKNCVADKELNHETYSSEGVALIQNQELQCIIIKPFIAYEEQFLIEEPKAILTYLKDKLPDQNDGEKNQAASLENVLMMDHADLACKGCCISEA